MARQPKYTHLLNDPDIARWYANNKRGSQACADNYLRGLGHFSEVTGVSPKELVKMPDEKRILFIEDFINANEPGRVKYMLKVVRSWLNRFNIRVPNFKIGRVPHPRLDKAFSPTQAQLRIVLGVSDVRQRAAIAIIALCGQRLETLGSHQGEDGIVLGDFRDLVIYDAPDPEHPGKTITDFRWEKRPAQLVIRETLSKKRHEYFTFVAGEALEYVSKMLKARVALGERLTKDSPFLVPMQAQHTAMMRKNPEHRFIWTLNVADIIRKANRASRVMDGNPPSIWRSYFQAHAEMSPLQRPWYDFHAGHQGDISALYSLHRRLPPEKIESMRKAFKTVLPFIESRVTPDQREEQVAALAAENAELKSRTPSEPRKGVASQKGVSLPELKDSLAFGWTFVTSLPDGTFIVSRN